MVDWLLQNVSHAVNPKWPVSMHSMSVSFIRLHGKHCTDLPPNVPVAQNDFSIVMHKAPQNLFAGVENARKLLLCGEKQLQVFWKGGLPRQERSGILGGHKEKATLIHTCVPAAHAEGERPIWDNKYSAAETKAVFTLQPKVSQIALTQISLLWQRAGPNRMEPDSNLGHFTITSCIRSVRDSGHIRIHGFSTPLSVLTSPSHHYSSRVSIEKSRKQ